MSTFKRLLNVGKGKLKVATRPSPAAPPDEPADSDWLTDARTKVADAVEGVADAIRPDVHARSAAPATERTSPTPRASDRSAAADHPAAAPAPEASGDPASAPKPKGPVKRHL